MGSPYFRFFVVLVLLAAGRPAVWGQSGLYFTQHYFPERQGYNNDNFALLQDDRHLLHLANRQGVLHFDGRNWWLTPTPYAIYSLAWYNGRLYAGGRGGLGVLTRTRPGGWQFTPLDSLHGHITRCVVWGDSLYYLAGNLVLALHPDQPQTPDTVWQSAAEYYDLTAGPAALYAADEDRGLQIIRGAEERWELPAGAVAVRFSHQGRALFFTDSATFYLQKGDRLEPVVFDNMQYLHDHDITDLIWVNDSLLAIGTLPGGVFFISPDEGRTRQVVDYDAGLPDNQINALFGNRAGEVWALHPLGLSLIAPGLPLSCFHHYPGLKGNLTKVLPHNGRLVVGTSLGVFRLEEKQQIKTNTLIYRKKVPLDEVEKKHQEQIKKKKKKGFLGLFGKKKMQAEEAGPQPRYKYVYQKRVVEEVVGINYEYEPIKAIEAKTEDLLAYNDHLLAGTVHGIYHIHDDTTVLIDQVPVRDLFGMPDQNLLFASTFDDEVRTYTYLGNHWDALNLLEGLHDHIEQIALDPQGFVWLCGMDSLYRLEITDNSLTDVEVFAIDNPHFEHIYSVNYQGEILFINSTGYFTYRNRQIVRYREIEEVIGLPRKYVVGQDGELWVNTGEAWYGANKDIKNSLNFLSLFKDPRAVATTNNRTFWVITAGNELYKIDAGRISQLKRERQVFLKEVRNEQGLLSFGNRLVVDQENSSLTFEFVAPEYTGFGQEEYRYRLRSAAGTRSPWSAWSTHNNIISYQFLAPGNYTLEVQMRQALGEILEAEPFRFEVIPPYWKRPWFYVAELVFFGTLLFLSFYLNRGRRRFTVINRLLGFLTLILIVEFFQTLAEYEFGVNESPVVNFFIQAFIALLILPVESVLRKWLTVSSPGKQLDTPDTTQPGP